MRCPIARVHTKYQIELLQQIVGQRNNAFVLR